MCVVQFIVCDHQEPGYLCPPVPHTLPVSPWRCSSFSLFNSCPILEVKHGVLGSSSPPRIGARPHAPPYPLLVEGYPRVQTSRPPGRGPWSSCVMPQPVHRKDATGEETEVPARGGGWPASSARLDKGQRGCGGVSPSLTSSAALLSCPSPSANPPVFPLHPPHPSLVRAGDHQRAQTNLGTERGARGRGGLQQRCTGCSPSKCASGRSMANRVHQAAGCGRGLHGAHGLEFLSFLIDCTHGLSLIHI